MGGMGENSYKTAEEWLATYYKPLNTNDSWDGKYVAILEPLPGEGGNLTIASSPPRFSPEAKQAIQQARALEGSSTVAATSDTRVLGIKGVSGMDADKRVRAEAGDVVEEANRWIVQAAIDGANEQLVPYDDEFAAVFENVVADNPLLVKSDAGDYYIVPFAKSYKGSIAKIDAMIAALETMKGEVPSSHESAIQASIDSLMSLRNELNTDRSEVMVVIIVDAEDGHFKEASWVREPVEYLPVTKEEALQIAGKPGATAELVYTEGSPYYPDWKITDGCSVYYVNQNGELYDADADCDGYLISEGDCNDNNAAVYPGAIEVCDGVDNNCDGEVDEGCPTEPSVIEYDSSTDQCCRNYGTGWCCELGWSNVDNVLERDSACAIAESDGFAYITLDMGETKNSGTITVRSAVVDCEGEPRYGDTIVYGSADNSNWITLGTFDTPEVNLADRTVSFSNQQVRYVKVYLPIAECGVTWGIDSITW